MKRSAIFILLAVLGVAWSMPGEAHNKDVARYGHQSQKEAQKAADKQRKEFERTVKKQQKRLGKYEKKQRRVAKKAADSASKNVSHHFSSGFR